MRINKVSITNFKCFEHLDVTFDQESNLHVIISENMVGKSAFMKALKIGISSYLNEIAPVKEDSLSNQDLRIGVPSGNECGIRMDAEVLTFDGREWGLADIEWSVYHERSKEAKSKVGRLEIEELGKMVIRTYERVIEKKEESLPLLMYVGPGYLYQPFTDSRLLRFDGNALQG